MGWVLYSLICAFSLSLADAISKVILKREDYVNLAFLRWGSSLPFLFLFLLIHGINLPPLKISLLKILSILIPLEIIAVILYMKAYKESDLSLSAPFQSFTPAFVLIFSIPLLKEIPSVTGISGILLVTAGGYIMNVDQNFKKNILAPFSKLKIEKGPVYMLMVAGIYGLTSVLGKMGVIVTNSTFFAVFYIFILSISFFLLLLILRGFEILRVFKNPLALPLGFFMSIMIYTHFKAIELIDVAYMISIKRMSMIFSIFLGHFLLREEKFHARLLGGIVMFAGGILISFGK